MYLELFKNMKARILKSNMLSAMGNQTAQAKEVGFGNLYFPKLTPSLPSLKFWPGNHYKYAPADIGLAVSRTTGVPQ